jgi:hypothetical protein
MPAALPLSPWKEICQVNINLRNTYTFYHELRSQPDASGIPLSSINVTGDLAELIEEAYTSCVLAEQFPGDLNEIDVKITPYWTTEPSVGEVEIRLAAGSNGSPTHGGGQISARRRFDSGPWVRSTQKIVQQLREEGTLAEDKAAYQLLTAIKPKVAAQSQFTVRPLQPPPIARQSLSELGVRERTQGSLVPDRPVLVNTRFVNEAIELCAAAGPNETGGAVLGKVIQLPEPLPGVQTRVVTVLTTLLTDPRHSGSMTRFQISPEALAEAAEVADLRGMGESVLTIFHSHGWGCGECNQKLGCPLAECFPSLHDYELESLFPTKALLLPIAGRKQGAAGRRPVLQIHAWRGGQMKPIRWQNYVD